MSKYSKHRPVLHNVKSGTKTETGDWYKSKDKAHEVGKSCVPLYKASHYTIESR